MPENWRLASTIIFLDESGDLGWKFNRPYRRGGSSRYLTLAALCSPEEKKHLPKRLMRKLYKNFGWNPAIEKKWALLNQAEKTLFANKVRALCNANADIYLKSIVVDKTRVQTHIRTDSNKLYNYMIKLLLLDYMKVHSSVRFIPDPRSIKVESSNSLHDYLQTELWFTAKTQTKLITTAIDSRDSLGIQFADMLSGIVQSRFEDNKTENYQIIAKHLTVKTLFFSI